MHFLVVSLYEGSLVLVSSTVYVVELWHQAVTYVEIHDGNDDKP